MWFLNNVSKSFLLIFIIPFVLGAFDTRYWWFLSALLMFDIFLGFIKYFIGNKADMFKRPDGAFACNIFCLPSNDEGHPGFPSGHVASTTMMLIILMYFVNNTFFTVFACTYIVLMALSRYKKKCHNVIQITGGFVFGIVGALAFIQLSPKEIWTLTP